MRPRPASTGAALGAGSGEILSVAGTTFLIGGKKVVGAEPTYATVYQQASAVKAEAIKVPLRASSCRSRK